ncbi:hypothetical protein BD311DRAFT_752346 [Dichomitus squalens]|uniref:Secreted protein n=1 Tax=Dichomitus squalens TaxID=114155 RepID=A0A4Q9MVJ5_9APHY|nr:hypothetical protein BD311DRAFT_752346 [Dichomitus squalens]
MPRTSVVLLAFFFSAVLAIATPVRIPVTIVLAQRAAATPTIPATIPPVVVVAPAETASSTSRGEMEWLS